MSGMTMSPVVSMNSSGGIKTVLIPEQNAKDLVEIGESIKKGLEIVLVRRTHVPSGNRPRPDLSDGWSLRKGQRPAARRANFKEPPAPPDGSYVTRRISADGQAAKLPAETMDPAKDQATSLSPVSLT